MNQIYLDNNATTRIDPAVVQAMSECYAQGLVNPASQHQAGQRSRRVLESARERIAQLLGCRLGSIHADRLIFTSGGTESNNLALLGLAGKAPARILVSSIEHPSVMGPARRLAQAGFDVQQIPALPTGVIDLDALDRLLTPDVRLVSVMLANNETGVLQPVREISARCRENDVLMHTDAVQVAGKLPLNFADLQVDSLSVSAHKLHGPNGLGSLITRGCVHLNPLFEGGFQQMGLRPGTESIALSIGFQTALDRFSAESEARVARMSSLRDQFEQDILAADVGAVVNCSDSPRVPHTSSIAFPGLDRQALMLALDMAGIACSTGSACASGSSEPSPVLMAMGLSPAVVESSLRFSIGADTTAAEIDQSVRRISLVAKDLRRSK